MSLPMLYQDSDGTTAAWFPAMPSRHADPCQKCFTGGNYCRR